VSTVCFNKTRRSSGSARIDGGIDGGMLFFLPAWFDLIFLQAPMISWQAFMVGRSSRSQDGCYNGCWVGSKSRMLCVVVMSCREGSC
jgi:hypothetical protein